MVTGANDSSRRPLVIFDLCDTLYAANTTVGFLGHFSQAGGRRHIKRALRRWTSRRSVLFYVGAVAHRLLKWDVARERLVATLAGERRQDLEEAAWDFASGTLPSLANHQLHDRLAQHRAAGDRVMIVSNSLDLIVAPIARMLGTEFEASTLGFSGDICTGRIDRDLTGRKASFVRKLIGAGGTISCVYTDNRSDLDLVSLAQQAAIVVPKGRREVHWGGSRCEYIRL